MLLALGSAVALCAALAIRPDAVSDGPVICPFRLATGLPCPGCGMTRAWVFLAHGRLGDALSANPFVLVTMPAAFAIVVLVAVAQVRRRPPPDLSRVAGSVVTKLLLAAWLLFAVGRLLLAAT